MILYLVTLASAAFVLGFVVGGVFAAKAQRTFDEQMFEMLEADRDLARHEANVLRGILCPVLNRKPAEVSQGEPASDKAAPAKPAAGPGAHPAGRGTPQTRGGRRGQRMSFRLLFNQARMLTNSKQRKTDALATALEKVKPLSNLQEKTHV